jgi:hypothetical protein
MAFGGYKFYGYHRGTTTNATLETHISRVAAFVMANAAANSSWSFDPDRLDGYYQITFDGNSYNSIHRLKNDNDTELGYATFFKYYDGNSGLTGYYVILTVEKVGFANRGGSPQSGYINFYFDQWCCPRGINYPKALQGFCLHALSLEPFGSLPSFGQPSSDLIPNKSTRLTPVGSCNIPNSGAQSYVAESTNSFIYTSNAYFGYAIKGADIISFATIDTSSPSINVLSLNAFGKYFNAGDSNGLLMFPTSSRTNYTNEIGLSDEGYGGYSGQFLDENGTALCCNCALYPSDGGSSVGQYASIEYSGMSVYNRNNVSSKVSIVGCAVGLTNYEPITMQSGLLGKGITNAEFLSMQISRPSSSDPSEHSIGETFNGGKQLVCHYEFSASVYNLAASSTSYSASLILLCGWDTNNPDIRQASSWDEYVESDWRPTT